MVGTEPNSTAIAYCADMVQRDDPDRFLTVMLAPMARRGDLASLYAFNLEVAKTREAVSEGLIGDIRLHWWREAVEECFSGGSVRRHAVIEALAGTIRRHNLPREPFERLLEARANDLDDKPPATLDDFNAYLDGTATPLADLALAVLGVDDPSRVKASREAALAFATIGQIRALPHLLRQRRHRLPGELLDDHGVDRSDLAEMRFHPALGRLVTDLCSRSEAHILAARSVRPAGAFAVIALARIADCYRRRLVRAGGDPFLHSIEEKPVLLPLLLMLDRIF